MNWHERQLSFSDLDSDILKQCGVTWQEIKRCVAVDPALPPLWSPLAYLMYFYAGDSVDRFWEEYRKMNRLRKCPEAHYYDMRLLERGKKARDLSVPDGELRRHQDFIQREILSQLSLPACVTAYRKGYNITHCAAPHKHAEVLIHLDIRNFFGSISKENVKNALVIHAGYPVSVAKLLADLCCCRDALPQGAPTSPALSNLVFRFCDKQLMELAEQKGLVYTRYADDLFFSGPIERPWVLISRVYMLLRTFGFQLNLDKTRIMRNGSAKKVMGLTVEDKVQVERSYRRALRQEIYYVRRFGRNATAAKAAGDYVHYLRQLQGRVAYVLSVSPEDEEFLGAARLLKTLLHQELYGRHKNYF